MMIFRGQQIDIPELSLYEMLRQTATRNPSQPATLFAGQEMTYGALHDAVLRFMGYLQATGVQVGDRVGIMLPNCPQYLIAYYAITGMGAVVVQVNPMSTAPELAYLVEDAGFNRLVIYDALVPIANSVRDKQQSLQLCVVQFVQQAVTLDAPDVMFADVIASQSPDGVHADFDAHETVAVLQYTGGTTGRPKGAMLTHANLVANTLQTQYLIAGGATSQDIMVCALPFFHVYAMTVCMNCSVYVGMPMLIVPRFDPPSLLEQIQKVKPTLFPAVPTMYVAISQLLPVGSTALASLRICNSGGAPMPEQVLAEFERVSGALVLEGYGLSETSPVTHANFSAALRKIGSIGQPVPGTEAKIVDVNDATRTLAEGEVGELTIRGPQVMKGYYGRPTETAETIVDGWLLTGDIARMDEEGFAYIVDRKKDLIIASGYNVYPRDVEEALYRHPAVLEAAVIGEPDAYRGETVKAVVVLKPDMELTAEDLMSWCKTQLSAYKVPKSVEFRHELPKTAVGKILRRALRV